MDPLRPTVLVLTGSARRASHTRRLGAAIADALPGGVLASALTVLPYFDQDLEATPPQPVLDLRRQVAEADAVVVVTPEYNGTVPGLLGNAVDWLSRPRGAMRGKPVLAVAASPGAAGGMRAVTALRTVLGNLGADVVGPPVTVAQVHDRLTDDALDGVVAEVRAHLEDALAAPRAA